MIKKKKIQNLIFKKFYSKFKLTTFLLKLLFSKSDKLRNTIFDTMHLKSFFEQENLQYLLKNHPNNKIVNYTGSENETAVLIPGRLRCWDKSKDFIYSLAEKNKVFIMTDNSDKKIISEINHKNINATCIDSSEYQSENSEVSNVSLSQYFKLKCVIEEVYKFEKKNSLFFKNFIKIRSDFYYFNADVLLDMTRENNENYLFSQSDLHFSGRREFLLPLKNFYDFSEWCYQNDFHNLDYMPINPTQIVKSDPGSTKFALLKFPEKIVETDSRRPSSNLIHKNLVKNYKNAMEYKYNSSDKFKLTGSPEYVATEQSFAWFLNLLGIPCKTHLKYAGFLMDSRGKITNSKISESVIKYQEDMNKIRNKKN